MFFNSKLPVLMVLLTLYGQGQTGKIIGGHVAVPHSRPYMVFIRRYLANNQEVFCDGFLLNENFVMTAAHCQAKNYTVFLGVDNTKYLKNNDKIQDRTVEKAIPHENYNKDLLSNDLMLLKLSSRAVLNNIVKPIALASHDDGTLPKSCVVSGWGQTHPSRGISDKLMELNVTLTENHDCTKLKLYCSVGMARPGQGDSGGPLVCGSCLAYGVVSFMSLYPNGSSVVAYTKIPDYIHWITSTMKKALSKN
ncbi:granzyme-like protein 1 [Anableps anableps]